MSEPEFLRTARKKGLVITEGPKSMFEGEGAPEDKPRSVTLFLPYPPTVNHYWISFVAKKRVMMILGKEGKEFREAVALAVRKLRVKSLKGPLKFEALFNPPDHLKRDCDNIIKPCLDALQHAGLYEDDNQIFDIHAVRGPIIRGGNTTVTVSEVD